MGDPKKTRKKYSTPTHPWQKTRIEDESELTKKYALKNKAEIWKMVSMLKGFKEQAKKLSSLDNEQAKKEKSALMKKLISLGMIKPEDTMESILTLSPEDLMERRLQTVVFKKGYARTMKQARQFIVHGHVNIGGKVVTSPSHIVLKDLEENVGFGATSALKDEMHPERATKEVKEAAPAKEEKKEKEENGKK